MQNKTALALETIMIGLNWIPNLTIKQNSRDDLKLVKKHMTAIVCSGKAHLAGKESLLNDEFNWLNSNPDSGFDNYRAVLINNNDQENALPALLLQNHPESRTANPGQHISNANEISQSQLQNSKICLACSVNLNLEKKTKVYPPYTFYYKPLNQHFSMMIDNEPDDITQLFRIPGFVEWLGIHKPKLLFSKEANNSEYLFHWLIYNIIKTDKDLSQGLFSGLNSLPSYHIGGLFNLFFTDGSGVYTFSKKEEIHNGTKTVFFKTTRDEHDVLSYILRNSEDLQDFDWIQLKANSLYYFPTSGKLRYYLCENSQIKHEVKADRKKHPSLQNWLITDFILQRTKNLQLIRPKKTCISY